jgi:hypothetical protein
MNGNISQRFDLRMPGWIELGMPDRVFTFSNNSPIKTDHRTYGQILGLLSLKRESHCPLEKFVIGR